MLGLNLIPPEQKNQIKQAHRLHHWLNAVLILTVICLLGDGLGGLSLTILKRHQAQIHQQLVEQNAAAAKQNREDITTATNKFNQTVSAQTTLLGPVRNWSKDATDILGLFTNDVTVNNLTIQADGHWQIDGLAATRQSFLTLDQLLKKSPLLREVSTTATASKRTDIPFNYTGRLTD